jgi:hypothetical protein
MGEDQTSGSVYRHSKIRDNGDNCRELDSKSQSVKDHVATGISNKLFPCYYWLLET